MRREIFIMLALVLACSLILVSGLSAQVKKDAETGLDRLSGRVQDIDKEKSIIRILQKDTTNAFWDVVYNDKTTFTYRNKPSSLAELKARQDIICLGKTEGKRLTASRVDIRDTAASIP